MGRIHYVTFKVISKCNWNCPYCSVISGPQYELPDYEKILSKIVTYLSKFSDSSTTYIISGGEPGLLPLDFFYALSKIKEKYRIRLRLNTNGTNLDNIYKLHVFDEIILHCSENLDRLNCYRKYPNVENMVVISKYNVSKLESFLQQYYNLDINYCVDTYNQFTSEELLSIKKCLQLYGCHSTKVEQYLKNSVRRKIRNDSYKYCRMRVDTIKIDLEHSFINLCCVDPSCKVEFTFENCRHIFESSLSPNCVRCRECNYLMYLK